MADHDGARDGRLYALYGVAGAALLAVAGAGYLLYREKSIEKPRHRTLEAEGALELRDYPDLLVAEASVAGERSNALDQGFGRLAYYVLAKPRGGGRVGMTAPVLSAKGPGETWVTRFVMPAEATRETLPEPGPGIRLFTLPARTVAAIRFTGPTDEATLAAREEELRAWAARRGLTASGEPERAFYNSPFVPGPWRRTEIWVPVA